MKKKVIKVTLSLILSFLLVLSILLSFTMNLIKDTVLSEEYVLYKLNEIDYYTKVDKNLKDEFDGYIQQSGFDNTIFNNIYTKQKLEEDVDQTIHSIYSYTESAINTDVIKENLNNNINVYIGLNNITVDVIQRENITIFVDKIADIYETSIYPKEIVTVLSNGVKTFNLFLTRYGQFLQLLPVVVILCIVLINISKLLNSFKYISLAFLSAGIFGITGYYILTNNIQLESINIFSRDITDILSAVLSNTFIQIVDYCKVASILGLLFTFIFIVIENTIKFEFVNHRGVDSKKWTFRY